MEIAETTCLGPHIPIKHYICHIRPVSYYVVAVSRSRRPTNRKLPLRVATTALNQRKFRETNQKRTPIPWGKAKKGNSFFSFYLLPSIFRKRGGGESVEFPVISSIFVYIFDRGNIYNRTLLYSDF